MARALVASINAARAAHGVGRLTADARLNSVAQVHAVDNASRRTLGHDWAAGGTTFDRIVQAGYRFSAAGECLDWYRTTPEAAVAAWMADPPHRAILLGPYRDVGVGHAVASNGTHFWASVYGLPA